MSAKFIPFFPEPVKGQAILNNFTRTLRYYGNDAVKTSLRRGMPLYEMRTREHVGTTGNSDNLVIRGECLSACAYLNDKGVKVDLVYIDPPFASGADYAKKIVLRRNPLKGKGSEAGAEITDEAHAAFEEKMYGDIWDKEKYLNWMYENLRAIKSVMSENASIYVHLDWHIGHYVKVMMDEIFGEENFRSEIIWKRSTAHSDSEFYGVNYDTIYFYTASQDSYVFNPVYQPYDDEYLSRFSRSDPDGRKWDSGNLTAKGLSGGGYDYEYKGFRSLWRMPKATMEKMDKEGRLYITKTGGIRSKVYLDELPGMRAQCIWADINPVNSQAKEKGNNNSPEQQEQPSNEQIKKALQIGGVHSSNYAWRCEHPQDDAEKGAQIDLAIDRDDGIVNLCEMKFASKEYAITARDDADMRNKRAAFKRDTKTRKAVHVTYVTTFGIARNRYAGEVQSEVTLDDLFATA